jgi:hypothetical protein
VRFNQEFSVRPRSSISRWKPLSPRFNLDYQLSIKISRRTDRYGVFLFHDHYFEIEAPRKSCVKFTLCLSESFGLKAFIDGRFYPVVMCDTLSQVRCGTMPMVEQDLISRYLLNDLHSEVV